MTITFFDLETTGLGLGLDLDAAHIVEFAALRYGWPMGDEPESLHLCLVNPGVHIPPEASAVHRLVDSDVSEAITEAELGEVLAAYPDSDALCGHNVAAYDLPIARARLGWPPAGVPVLDTYRLARHVWPDLPSYKLEVLAYRFGLHPSDELASLVARPETCSAIGAHSAGYDCLLCVNLLRRILQEVKWCKTGASCIVGTDDVEASGDTDLFALAALSASPITVKTMRFGKHAGQPVADLPRDYVVWLMRQPWLATDHPDLLHTLAPQTGK